MHLHKKRSLLIALHFIYHSFFITLNEKFQLDKYDVDEKASKMALMRNKLQKKINLCFLKLKGKI
jgi:hypothetical protein